MFSLFNRKPAEPMMTVAEHERIVAGWVDDLRATHARLNKEVATERGTVSRQIETIRKLRTERDEALAKIQRMTGGLSKGTAAAVAKRKAASQQPA